MKPHPRIRKTIKWGGAAVTVLLVVVWVGSGWWRFGYAAPKTGYGYGQMPGTPWDNRSVFVDRGRLLWMEIAVWRGGWAARPFDDWGFAWEFRYIPSFAVVLPLWAPTVAALLITAAAWRLDTLSRRRARVGLCPTCHYDRAGLAAGAVCPECGAAAV